ncbi:AI-2E family transporter [Bacillus sp. RG28]|uniref:AI-2E family transporter n=1 Tax=Gottfriedia endophytica TaxID=2820819 RepID=A0A940SFB1_9BACI|nr:AI-2E family transporter [Gottfriedia endophytica]MBP0723797.1 AI-2E family transporter [Gottfriedia endophytica]
MENLKIKWIYRLCLLLLIGLVCIVFYYLKPVYLPIINGICKAIIPFVIAFVISYLLHPLIQFIHKKGMKRGYAILLIYFLFFGGIALGIYLLLPVLREQWNEILKSFPRIMALYDLFINKINVNTSRMPHFLHQRIDLMINGAEKWAISTVDKSGEMAKHLINNFLFIVLIPVIVFYFLKDYKFLSRLLLKLVPRKWRNETVELTHQLDLTFGKYIRGQVLVCFLLFIFATIFFWIFRMKFALVLGLFIGITDLIPYFGPIIGAIPALFLALSISYSMVVRVAIIIIVLQIIESNVLSPFIIGKSVHIHPIIIMFTLLVGGEIGGILGLLISVPTLVIGISFIRYLKQRKGHMPS